ncbi:MAG TPA: DinB family protein [Candidatus Angelobacter sp.]|jgi:hypothetical protein|nr:DinB family protein [Candidatus Angelobacter sp.]
MNFNVQSVSRDIADSRRRAQALIDAVSADQLTRRPDPGKWSIAECLMHLNITAATVQKLMARGIEQAKQEKRFGKGPFSVGPKGRLRCGLPSRRPNSEFVLLKTCGRPQQSMSPYKCCRLL